MTEILVTGAGGFIGRHLVGQLTGSGVAVRAVSRTAGRPDAPGLERRMADIGALTDLRPIVAGVGVIVHLAARAHITREAATDPLAAFREINRDVTLRLARAAAQEGARRFVFVSSIGVLGDRTGAIPFRATDPAAPDSPYSRSKWEAEAGLRAVARETGIEVVIIRPPLVHGPGAPGNFARLIALVDRTPVLPFGSVHNRRSYVGVENLCDLLTLVARHPAAAQQTLLVADDGVCSTADLVDIIAAARGRRVRNVPAPTWLLRGSGWVAGRGGELTRLLGSLEVDDSFTRTRLGWRPRVGLREGLAQMAESWRPRS